MAGFHWWAWIILAGGLGLAELHVPGSYLMWIALGAAVTGGLDAANEIGDAPPTQIFRLNELAWTDALPGIRAKRIWSDPATERFAVLGRWEPGAKLALHRHTGDELIFVIEGSMSDDYGEVTAGNVSFRPQGCVHTVTSRNGATTLAIVRGGSEPL